MLHQYSIQGQVKVLKFIENYEKKILFCDKHPRELATDINIDDFTLMCHTCSEVQDSNKEKLERGRVEAILTNNLVSLIQNSKSEYLNKFHLSLTAARGNVNLIVLIYEAKALLNAEKVQILRCSSCFKQLSFG